MKVVEYDDREQEKETGGGNIFMLGDQDNDDDCKLDMLGTVKKTVPISID